MFSCDATKRIFKRFDMMENDIIDIPSVKQALYLLNIQPGDHLQHMIDLFCQNKE